MLNFKRYVLLKSLGLKQQAETLINKMSVKSLECVYQFESKIEEALKND